MGSAKMARLEIMGVETVASAASTVLFDGVIVPVAVARDVSALAAAVVWLRWLLLLLLMMRMRLGSLAVLKNSLRIAVSYNDIVRSLLLSFPLLFTHTIWVARYQHDDKSRLSTERLSKQAIEELLQQQKLQRLEH